jgi:hypothetical protein
VTPLQPSIHAGLRYEVGRFNDQGAGKQAKALTETLINSSAR